MKKKTIYIPGLITPRLAAGDFSASVLLGINLKAEQVWADGTQANQYKAHAESVAAVLANQTAKFAILDNPDKDRQVKVTWMKTCGLTTSALDSECALSGPQIESTSKSYAFDIGQQTSFSVDRFTSRTNEYDPQEAAAEDLIKAVNTLDEYWNAQILLKLKSFSGVNVDQGSFTWDAGNLTTDIPAASYSLKMVAELQRQSYKNLMNAPYYIERGDLWVPVKNAQFDFGNLDGKGDVARTAALNMSYDLFGFDKAAITENLFAVDKNAVAFKTFNRHTSVPKLLGGSIQQMIYTVPSNLLSGVSYDVFYTLTCQNINGDRHYIDTWVLQTRGGIWLNPEGCPVVKDAVTYNPTGVISYTKTA